MKLTKYRISILEFAGGMLLFVFFTGIPLASSAEVLSTSIFELNPRPGITLRCLLIRPDNPVASVILFEGGPGKLAIEETFGKPRIGIRKGTLLVRNVEDFAKSRLTTVLVDAPSDKQSQGLPPSFRISDEHLQDIRAVVSHLRKESDLPIWLVGISLGACSSALGGVRITEGIDGIVLISGVNRVAKGLTASLLDMGLASVTVPALIMYHKGDECHETAPSNAPLIKDALVQSPKVEIVYMTGGKNEPDPRSPVPQGCQPLTYHAFYGIEKQVVSTIAEFIESNSKR